MGSMSRFIIGTGLVLTLTTAFAQNAPSQNAPSQNAPSQRAPARSEVSHSTRAWRDLQSSNTEAAPALPMLGAEAGLAYRRYLESFNSKIPDLYESALTSNGNGNGSGSGGSPLGSGSSGSGSH